MSPNTALEITSEDMNLVSFVLGNKVVGEKKESDEEENERR